MADELKITEKKLSKVTNKKRTDTKGITLHCYPDWYDNKAQYGGFDKVQLLNSSQEGYGFTYLIDEYDIVETITPEDILNPWANKKPTYISTNLFENKPEEHTLSVCIFISSEHDYEKTELRLVKFLADLLDKNKLKTENIWRGFDLSKEDKGPTQYLDVEIFKKLIAQIDAYITWLADDDKDKKDFEFVSPFTTEGKTVTEVVKAIFDKCNENVDAYMAQFEPWDKDKAEIKQAEQKAAVGDLKSLSYPTKNKLQYKITNIAPGTASHCVRASDKLEGIETEEDAMVEPIYPDLITPPGGQINVSNGKYDAAVQSSSTSTTPITVEDFMARSKTFDMSDFKDVKKETKGRPINTDDPFPVDEQIKKLEEHYPKVKIDKTTFDFTEDNHPDSAIGKAMAKNYAMTYDMINEISKRTEKRLVKIENNLSTVMRNLFRMSSRVNINCVYYGGQSVYGKYKCIRCMHDNRLDDGAIVTMDQCLCCTRYEPILGQVYAILDDAGSNVSQIVDDLQMAYMDLPDYQVFNNVNEFAVEPKAAVLTKDSTQIPKEFREDKWADTEEEKKAKAEAKAKKAAANATSGEAEEKKDESILIKYDDIKDYLNEKLEEVIIIDGNNKELTREEYIILNKYEFIQTLTDNINKDPDDKKYYDDSGNVITRDEYIKLLTKKLKDSYVNDDYFNGFKMDWNPVLLETQKANINSYDVEALKSGKTSLIGNSDHQPDLDRELFLDSREDNTTYEKLEFNIKDYTIPNFGFGGSSGATSSSGSFGLVSSEARNKIVEYAKNAVDLCAQGKAFYDQGKRMQHDENAVNGVSYWDCSSLVEGAYKAGGVTGVAGTTATEYPACLDANGGLLIPISEVDKGIAGDMVWCYSGNKPTTQAELQNIEYSNTSLLYHVGIYIGDGKYAHASGHSSNPNIKISEVANNSQLIAFGRPKDLINLDNQASKTGGSNAEAVAAIANDADLQAIAKAFDERVEQVLSYHPEVSSLPCQHLGAYICAKAKSYSMSPYMMMGICFQESTYGLSLYGQTKNNFIGMTVAGQHRNADDFKTFNTPEECIDSLADDLKRYRDELGLNISSSSAIAHTYEGEGGEIEATWARNIYNEAKLLSNKSGIALDITA